MEELSGEARKTKQVAISEGCEGRPIGLVNSDWAFSFIVAGIRGVQTGPGATALTRMPRPTYWLWRPRVKEMMAPFVDV
jgi:hypothetical protein